MAAAMGWSSRCCEKLGPGSQLLTEVDPKDRFQPLDDFGAALVHETGGVLPDKGKRTNKNNNSMTRKSRLARIVMS